MATKDKNKTEKFSFRLDQDLNEAVQKYLQQNPEITFSILIRIAIRKYLGEK
jgi:metal-responsive CopG/Arc/MetJ family transcriptional regulator